MAYGNSPLKKDFFNTLDIPSLYLLVVVDCYYPAAPEAILLIVGLKNVVGFGFSYSVIPWITASGYAHTFGALAGIQCAIVLLGLPLWWFGKRIRNVTGKWKIIMW